MRILFVNDHARVTGGADLHCFQLGEMLTARGHEVRFLSTQHVDNVVDQGAFVRLLVTRESRQDLSLTSAARVATAAVWNRSASAAARRIAGTFKPDVVHCHKLYPQLSVAPVWVARERGIPVVQTVHDYEFVSASAQDSDGRWWDGEEDRLSYRALNTALFGVKRRFHVPAVSSWISVSRSVAATYERQAGISSVTIPNFVQPRVASQGPAGDREGALYVGRLSREKGIDDVIDLARERPSLSVTIAGAGPLAPEVEAVARNLPNIRYLGALDSAGVEEAMSAARLVVIPSRWEEPGPLVALEAMRAGTPIVAYANGGLGEYVEDASAGLVVSPGVSGLLEGADAVVHASASRREAWTEAGRRAATSTHAPERYVTRLEQVYATAAGLA